MSGQPADDGPDQIDRYLDELADRLRGPGAHRREILAEAEAHLRDAAEAAAAAAPGTSPERSTAIHSQVIDGFGTPAQVARAHNRELLRPARLAGPAGLLIGQLVSIGLLAMGASAIVLALLSRGVGRDSMFADPLGVHPSPASCAHWLHLHPTAGSCVDALTAETGSDAIVQRAMAGILGLLLLSAVLLVRRRRPAWSQSVIPRGSTAALAFLAFLPAALSLIGLGVDRVVVAHARGAGMWFADGSVSLIAAVVCLAVVLRHVLGDTPRSTRQRNPHTV